MTTFVTEQVKRLDADLSRSIERSINCSTSSLQALSENDQFLLQTTQALDLKNANIPSVEKLQAYLQEYLETVQTNAVANSSDLEWHFIAKCTIAVYGHVFATLLELTLPLSESIDYWNSIQGNTSKEIYYALQVAPSRIFQLLRNTVLRLCSNSFKLKDLVSMDFILTQLFPVNRERQNRQQYPKIRADVLKLFHLSPFHQQPFLIEAIRNEIGLKKRALQRRRSEHAASLGVLLLTPPRFESSIPEQTRRCVELMKYIMTKAYDENSNSENRRKNANHFQKQFAEQKIGNVSAKNIAIELSQVLETWSQSCQARIATVQSLYGIPSAWTRYWIPALLFYYVGGYTISYGLERQDDVLHYTAEIGKTAYDFLLNWVWEPILKVYNTVRLKDQRLSLLSKEGLQSDLDSLERMVVGFAKDNLHLPVSELSRLALDVRQGDISILLKEYEREIKNPLRNVIAGDLLQTMLIQVQKVKVDVDLAMSALDKLLKSNELNFAFLAVAPSMLLTYASASWLQNRLQGRARQKTKKAGLPIKETLRRIERQLIIHEPIGGDDLSEWKFSSSSSEKQEQFDCETQGILLCEVHLLRSLAQTLPHRNNTRERFLEDIRDLENPNLTNEQKLQTVARMYRFWKFLQ